MPVKLQLVADKIPKCLKAELGRYAGKGPLIFTLLVRCNICNEGKAPSAFHPVQAKNCKQLASSPGPKHHTAHSLLACRHLSSPMLDVAFSHDL